MIAKSPRIERADEAAALRKENERLKSSLRRCRKLVNEWRSKLAGNSNGDFRPPYEAEDRAAGQRN